MPIIQNPDGSLRYTDTEQAPQRPNVPTQRVPAQTAPQTSAVNTPQTAQNAPQLDMSALDRAGLNMTALDAPEELNKPESLVANDIAAGLAVGATTESFTASMGTTLESWMPSWMPSRIMLTDEEGNPTSPHIKTMPEYLGITPEKWDNMPAETRRKRISAYSKEQILKLTEADPDSTAYMLSNLAGMLVDPTSKIPFIGTTMKARAGFGAAVGAADMAAYETAQKGAPTLGGVGTGVVLGGTFGGLSRALGKNAGHTNPKVHDNAVRKVRDFETALKNNFSKTTSPSGAFAKTLSEFKLNQDGLDVLLRDSGHPSVRYMAKARGVTAFDKLVEPISERMKRISPRLWKQIQDMERNILGMNHKYLMESEEFVKKMHTLNKTDPVVFNQMKKALLNDDRKTFNKFLSGQDKKFRKAFEMYDKAMKENYALSKNMRRGDKAKLAKEVDLYMHRAVKDHEAVRKWLDKEERTRIDKIIHGEYTGKGIKPTEEQLNQVYSKYLSGFYDAKGMNIRPGASRRRRIKEIPDEMLHAFHDPAAATHTYIRSNVEDAYRKSFFGRKLVDKYGDELNDDLFGELAQREVAAGRMKIDDVDEIKKLISIRMIDGVKRPDKWVQQFKDLSYSTLLGNPISAITQIGDIFIAGAKYGLRDTVSSMISHIGGRKLSPREMGLLDSLLEEMVSTTSTKKWLTGTLRASGFQAVDSLGKSINLNAAIIRAGRMAKSPKGLIKLQAKWGKAYGDDFGKLVDDLKAGKLTDETKTLAFAELADVQPITLFEMPEKYLTMTNGRLFYMLRTFQMKFFNMLRQHSYYEFKNGNYRAGLESAAVLTFAFTAGGASTDMIKNWVLGRDPYVEDMIVDNLLRTTGLVDRYSGAKFMQSSDPVPKFVENMMPPFSVLSPATRTMMQFAQDGSFENVDEKKLVAQIPVIGKILENFAMGGAEEYNMKRWKEH